MCGRFFYGPFAGASGGNRADSAQAWRTTRRHFYDRTVLINKDWNKTLERTLVQAGGVRTVRALHRLINGMLGELKTSHLGLMLEAHRHECAVVQCI